MRNIVQAVYHSRQRTSKTAHFHDCHQMILILKGQAEFCVNGNPLSAQAGDLAVFSRYENHSLQSCSWDYERLVLQIDPEVVRNKSDIYALLTDRPYGFCNVIPAGERAEAIAALFRSLIEEHGSSAAMTEDMEGLLVQQLLILLYRCSPVDFDGLSDRVVSSLKRHFENHYAEPCTLDTLAAQFHISASSLSHRFREATGISVMHYLQSIRMACAKRLLAQSDRSIGEIVESCGFSDASNFTRTFRRLNGCSPSAFRERYRKGIG